MILDQVFYRARQFRQAMGSSPDQKDLEKLGEVLTPAQAQLFVKLQRSEQAHALRVFTLLWSRSEVDPLAGNSDLLVAALLHDVGKCRYPLSLWERVLIVLGKSVFPKKSKQWGANELVLDQARAGWFKLARIKRPFVVAEKHPDWGAEMAAEAGISPTTESLIRAHQNFSRQKPVSLEDQLLTRLQAADGSN